MLQRFLTVHHWLMSCLARRIVFIQRHWYWLTLTLIVAAVLTTWQGLFELKRPEYSTPSTQFYQSLKVLYMASSVLDTDTENNPWLEAGRWLGATVFFGGVLGILLQLFAPSALSLFVFLFARKHVILAGLGLPEDGNDQLVKQLRRHWKSVVIIEPNSHHVLLDVCRKEGAVILTGSPYDRVMLKRAQIGRAESIIMLSGDDRENMGLAFQACELLNAGHPRTAREQRIEHPFEQVRTDQVSCLLGVLEPSLVEVIRHDRIYTDSSDRLRLNVFCLREMVARAMLRETRLLDHPRPIGSVLVVGLGKHLRLGEALVTRAAKDWHIDRNDHNVTTTVRLVIDVLDRESETFVNSLASRVGYLKAHPFESWPTAEEGCFLRAIPRQATRCGFRGDEMRAMLTENRYDAIFICLADEGMAVRQGIELRRTLDEIPGCDNVAVVVRVLQEDSGFGPLLTMDQATGNRDSRPGKTLIAVGFRDRVQDVMLSMNPEVEMLAQVLHQQYLLTLDNQIRNALSAENPDESMISRLRGKQARRSWKELHESFRQSNRDLAVRLSEYVEAAARPGDPASSLDLAYAPHAGLSPELGLGLTAEQIEALARAEHDNWVTAQFKAGWRLDRNLSSADPQSKCSPFLLSWDELDQATREYDIDIIKHLAITFAKADYRLTSTKAQPRSARASVGS